MTQATARLTTIPWHALDGLGPTLAPALEQILHGHPAERVLDKLLRAHRTFSPEHRTVCAEALFGVGLWRRRLAALLPPTPSPPAPLALAAALARDLGHAPDAPRWLGVDLPPARPLPDDWRVLTSVPDWLADTLTAEFGPDAPALADALNTPGPVTLRANPTRTTRDTLADALLREGITTRPGAWARDALVITSPRPNLYGLPDTLSGHFEVQDEGSQVLGELLGAHPGEDVLDLCAGAGGKSLQLATHVAPSGRVHASDVDAPRLDRLRTRASRARATVLVHGARPPDALQVPRVLVDAPCSELGALRRGPDVRWRLDPRDFTPLPALQLELLQRGARHLAPQGTLVYATCTWRHEENEAVVDAALKADARLALVRPALPDVLLDPRGFLRLAPHRHGTDGFFAAVLTRPG